jgi:hypothetical protein
MVETPEGQWVRWGEVNCLLKEIAELSAAHHGDQEKHILLHALTIDIPARCEP